EVSHPPTVHPEQHLVSTQAAPADEPSPLRHFAKAILIHEPPPHAAEALRRLYIGHLEVVLGAELPIRAGGEEFMELKLRLAPRVVDRLFLDDDAQGLSPGVVGPTGVHVLAF